MNRIISGILAGAFLIGMPVVADSWCWDACRWDGCWELRGEALCWEPSGLDWTYGSGESDVKMLAPNYDWGFRVLGGYTAANTCSFLTLDWVYLRPTDLKVEDGDLNIASLVDVVPGRGVFKVKTQYNRVNLRGGYTLYRGRDVSFYMFGGVRWLEIKSKRSSEGLFDPEYPFTQQERTRYWGVGIETGVGGDYCLGCGFSLKGFVGGTAALGKRSFHEVLLVPNNFVANLGRRSETDCVPGVDFRLGLNYSYDCYCLSLSGEIGYEMNAFFNTLLQRPPNAQITDHFTADTDLVDVGFAGLYIGLSICF